MIQIRRAVEIDALAVHDAHMESIRTVCIQHHTVQEVATWGGRPFNLEK